MFTAQDIKQRAMVRPFQPFRIVTGSGESYQVTHPDLVFIGINDVIVGIGSSEHPEFYEQVSRVAIMHVTALEDLPFPAPSKTGDGQK